MSPNVLLALQILNAFLSMAANSLEGIKRLQAVITDENGNLREPTPEELAELAALSDQKFDAALAALGRSTSPAPEA